MVALHALSYLAGLLDGEGSVGYHSYGGGRRRFVMKIKMASEPVIDWLLATFGGLKQFHPRARPHHKDQWRWQVQGPAARDLYMQVKPLLKIKNVIEFASHVGP